MNGPESQMSNQTNLTAPASMPGDAAGGVTGMNVIDGKHEPDRIYRVIGKDNSVVERTARDVVEGTTLLGNWELWRQNFKANIERVRRWCGERQGLLKMALVDIRSNKTVFYFVPESSRYDLELGSAMTDLEVELTGSGGIGYVETLQVPERSMERFVGRRSLILWERDENTAA